MIRKFPQSAYHAWFRKPALVACLTSLCLSSALRAEVVLDYEVLGKSLGGWQGKRAQSAEYALSGSNYRTFRPEITPTPEGGIFISVRIDYRRGFLASDDFATLEMTFGPDGKLESTSGSIAIQGKRINSEVIRSGATIGGETGAIGSAVKMGGELVASLTEKLTMENVVEAGRVTFPAAVRHNYNRVFQAVRYIPPVQVPALLEQKPARPGAALDMAKGSVALPSANAPAPTATTPATPTASAPSTPAAQATVPPAATEPTAQTPPATTPAAASEASHTATPEASETKAPASKAPETSESEASDPAASEILFQQDAAAAGPVRILQAKPAPETDASARANL